MKEYDYWDINDVHRLVLTISAISIIEADIKFQSATGKHPAKLPGIVVRRIEELLPDFTHLLMSDFRKNSLLFTSDKKRWKAAFDNYTPAERIAQRKKQ